MLFVDRKSTKKEFVYNCRFINPARSVGFRRIGKIPSKDQQIQLGTQNVHLGKTHFKDPNIDAQIFSRKGFIRNNEIPGTSSFMCCVFHYHT